MPTMAAAQPRAAIPFAPFAALVLGALAMSISPTLVRLADVGPFASAFARVALSLPLLWVWMAVSERTARGRVVPRPRRFGRPTVLAGLAFTADLLCWHLSITKTTIANATFFTTMAPVWVVLVGWLLFGRRPDRAVLAGLALCILGGSALVGASFRADLSHVAGDLLGIATGFFFGLYFLAVSAARRDAGAARVTFEMSVVAVAGLLIVALLREPVLLPASPRGWAVLLVMGWVSQAGGQGLLSVALGALPAVFSSLVIFLETIAAAIVAWAALGEAVSPLQAVGGVVIVAGIWVARPRTAVEPSP